MQNTNTAYANTDIISKFGERKDESVDKSSGVGKHNYAMLLLASRLGLRASDIANLKFSNIDRNKNEIKLTQSKTRSSYHSASS